MTVEKIPVHRFTAINSLQPNARFLGASDQVTVWKTPDIPQPTETSITNILLPSLFGSGVFGTSQFGGSTDPMVRKTITGSGHAANFRIRSSDQKSSYSINGMYIDYVPSGRR